MQVLKLIYQKAFYVFLLVAFSGMHLRAQAPVSIEYQVKAAFLYNFTQFVEWAPESFDSADAPFIFGIVGPDPFGKYIDDVVAGEKAMGHPIMVQRYEDIADAEDCHILFVSRSYKGGDTAALQRENILTVCEAGNFATYGGVIGFFTESGKIKFQVNLQAAKSANLVISSKLLRVAKVIDQ